MAKSLALVSLATAAAAVPARQPVVRAIPENSAAQQKPHLFSKRSWSANTLIAFRVLQGVSGGLMAPMAQLMMARVAGKYMARVMGYAAVPILLGPILGPVDQRSCNDLRQNIASSRRARANTVTPVRSLTWSAP